MSSAEEKKTEVFDLLRASHPTHLGLNQVLTKGWKDPIKLWLTGCDQTLEGIPLCTTENWSGLGCFENKRSILTGVGTSMRRCNWQSGDKSSNEIGPGTLSKPLLISPRMLLEPNQGAVNITPPWFMCNPDWWVGIKVGGWWNNRRLLIRKDDSSSGRVTYLIFVLSCIHTHHLYNFVWSSLDLCLFFAWSLFDLCLIYILSLASTHIICSTANIRPINQFWHKLAKFHLYEPDKEVGEGDYKSLRFCYQIKQTWWQQWKPTSDREEISKGCIWVITAG